MTVSGEEYRKFVRTYHTHEEVEIAHQHLLRALERQQVEPISIHVHRKAIQPLEGAQPWEPTEVYTLLATIPVMTQQNRLLHTMKTRTQGLTGELYISDSDSDETDPDQARLELEAEQRRIAEEEKQAQAQRAKEASLRPVRMCSNARLWAEASVLSLKGLTAEHADSLQAHPDRRFGDDHDCTPDSRIRIVERTYADYSAAFAATVMLVTRFKREDIEFHAPRFTRTIDGRVHMELIVHVPPGKRNRDAAVWTPPMTFETHAARRHRMQRNHMKPVNGSPTQDSDSDSQPGTFEITAVFESMERLHHAFARFALAMGVCNHHHLTLANDDCKIECSRVGRRFKLSANLGRKISSKIITDVFGKAKPDLYAEDEFADAPTSQELMVEEIAPRPALDAEWEDVAYETREQVRERLLGCGVPVDRWGKGGTRTLDSLLDEVEAGKVRLVENDKGQIRRILRVVKLKIMRKGKMLIETHSQSADGKIKLAWTVMSAKVKVGQEVYEAAEETLKVKLGDMRYRCGALDKDAQIDFEFKTEESPSFPGFVGMVESYSIEADGGLLPGNEFTTNELDENGDPTNSRHGWVWLTTMEFKQVMEDRKRERKVEQLSTDAAVDSSLLRSRHNSPRSSRGSDLWSRNEIPVIPDPMKGDAQESNETGAVAVDSQRFLSQSSLADMPQQGETGVDAQAQRLLSLGSEALPQDDSELRSPRRIDSDHDLLERRIEGEQVQTEAEAVDVLPTAQTDSTPAALADHDAPTATDGVEITEDNDVPPAVDGDGAEMTEGDVPTPIDGDKAETTEDKAASDVPPGDKAEITEAEVDVPTAIDSDKAEKTEAEPDVPTAIDSDKAEKTEGDVPTPVDGDKAETTEDKAASDVPPGDKAEITEAKPDVPTASDTAEITDGTPIDGDREITEGKPASDATAMDSDGAEITEGKPASDLTDVAAPTAIDTDDMPATEEPAAALEANATEEPGQTGDESDVKDSVLVTAEPEGVDMVVKPEQSESHSGVDSDAGADQPEQSDTPRELLDAYSVETWIQTFDSRSVSPLIDPDPTQQSSGVPVDGSHHYELVKTSLDHLEGDKPRSPTMFYPLTDHDTSVCGVAEGPVGAVVIVSRPGEVLGQGFVDDLGNWGVYDVVLVAGDSLTAVLKHEQKTSEPSAPIVVSPAGGGTSGSDLSGFPNPNKGGAPFAHAPKDLVAYAQPPLDESFAEGWPWFKSPLRRIAPALAPVAKMQQDSEKLRMQELEPTSASVSDERTGSPPPHNTAGKRPRRGPSRGIDTHGTLSVNIPNSRLAKNAAKRADHSGWHRGPAPGDVCEVLVANIDPIRFNLGQVRDGGRNEAVEALLQGLAALGGTAIAKFRIMPEPDAFGGGSMLGGNLMPLPVPLLNPLQPPLALPPHLKLELKLDQLDLEPSGPASKTGSPKTAGSTKTSGGSPKTAGSPGSVGGTSRGKWLGDRESGTARTGSARTSRTHTTTGTARTSAEKEQKPKPRRIPILWNSPGNCKRPRNIGDPIDSKKSSKEPAAPAPLPDYFPTIRLGVLAPFGQAHDMLLEETDTPKANNKGLIRVKVRLQYAHAHKVSNAPNLPTPTGERPATSAIVGSGITPTSLVPPGPHRKNTPSRVLSPGHLWHEAGRSSSSMSLEKDWNAWNSPRLLAPALPPLKHR